MTNSPQGPDSVERSLSEFFGELRRTEVAPGDTWERLAPRIATGESDTPRVSRRAQRGRWLGATALAASMALVAFLALNPSRGDGVASAREILERAELAATSPQAVGIDSLIVEQRLVGYFIGEEHRGMPYLQGRSRAWYEAPSRQRIEFSGVELAPDGDLLSESSSVSVWDGTERWTYDVQPQTASVRRQDPDADIYGQGVLYGGIPMQETDLGNLSCREANVIGQDEILGRLTDVIELSRPTCGFTLPGGGGQRVVWVDRETSLVLKTEQYAVGGQLSFFLQVTALEINAPIDEPLLSFTPPPGVEVDDRRDDPLRMGTPSRIEPRSLSLDEATSSATFSVRSASALPDGFELESVQQWWLGIGAEERPTVANDWVLLRYADDDGNWLLISQGFGGLLPGLASIAPPEIERGTLEVRGAAAEWIDGRPLTNHQWEPGVMRLMVVDTGRVGSGWAIGPDGERVTGSPSHIALASNVLTIDQLVEVAEGLE